MIAALPSAREKCDQSSYGLLDCLLHGLLLYDRDLHLAFVNRFCRELLARSRSVQMHDEWLRFDDLPTRERYAGVFARASGGKAGTLLVRSVAEPSMIVIALPIGEPHLAGLRIAIVISVEDRAAAGAAAALAALHRLTAAEARVLGELVKDRSPAEIAEAAAVSVRTVRTQLSSIYSKASVANQRELMALVSRFPPFAVR